MGNLCEGFIRALNSFAYQSDRRSTSDQLGEESHVLDDEEILAAILFPHPVLDKELEVAQ